MVGLDAYPPTPPPWFHFEDPILPKHGAVDVASAEPYTAQVGQDDGGVRRRSRPWMSRAR